MIKDKMILRKLIYILYYLLSFFLILIPFWFKKKFGIVYFDQLVFHLELLFSGSLVGDAQVQKSLYKWSLISSILLTLIYCFFKKKVIPKKVFSKKKEFLFFTLLFFLSIGYNTALFKSISFNKNDFFDKNYLFEEPITINNKKRNLILVYVESLDNIFANKKIFEIDLLEPLNINMFRSNTIENFYQIPGYSFTINSLVATQCGIPAKPVGFFKASELKNIKKFLPNIKCLSDYSKELNYKNIFITSDEIENFGVKNFLINHNYKDENIFDVKKLNEAGYKTSKFAWRGKKSEFGGIHDNILFEASLDIVKNNLNNNEPFFLSIYTLDTHSPRGYPNPECLKSKFKDSKILNNYTIKNSVICTVDTLKDFLLEISSITQNTDIVIMGDHAFPSDIEKDSNLFNKFILKKKEIFNRTKMNHFDFFPSLLYILGYEFSENKLALGFNIFGKVDIDIYNNFISNLDKKLLGKSQKYISFWK